MKDDVAVITMVVMMVVTIVIQITSEYNIV